MIGFKTTARKFTNLLIALLLVSAQLFAPISAIIPKATAVGFNCTNDTAGANDEPNQKDLTRMCVNYDGAPTTVSTTWNWDDLGTSGSNTLDACNLFDTDNDGKINYAVCVTTSGNPASIQTLTTYSCGDDKVDRCTSPNNVVSNGTTSCSISSQNTDPFPSGDVYPTDIQGACTIQLSTVGGSAATLVDVCSYPSQQPNSDPSDCVIFINDPVAIIEVVKDIVPNGNSGLFNLTVDGPGTNDTTTVNNRGDGGTTGLISLTPPRNGSANATVSETAGTGTNLSNYSSSISCVNRVGGQVVASGTGTSLSVPISDGSNIICTITNTAASSITIVKDAVPNDAQDFAFTTTGTGTNNFSLDDDTNATLPNTVTFSNLSAGTYTFAEGSATGWYLDGIECPNITETKDLTTGNVSLTITAGQNITCTFTNRKLGQIAVTKQTNPHGDPQVFSITASGTNTISGDATRSIIDDETETFTVRHGEYDVNEQDLAGWSEDVSACQNLVIDGNTPLVNGIPTRSCTITNTKLAVITIIKDALPNHDQDFAFTTTGTGLSNFSLDDDSDATLLNQQTFSNLTPNQQYSVTEQATPGWSLTGLTCNNVPVLGNTATVTPTPGQTISCTFTNTKLISVSGTKFEVNAGATTGGLGNVLSGWTIFIDSNNNGILDSGEASDITDSNGDYSFENLLYGTTVVLREVLQAGWTQIFGPASLSLSTANDVTDQDFGNFENASISGFKWNDADADDILDTDEVKLNGWTITLYNDGTDEDTNLDDVVASTVTAGTGATLGSYTFTNLVPGTYAVCETAQAGWTQTYPDANSCHTIVINESGESNAANFGNQGRGSIQVNKNVDTDGDGDVDATGATDWTWDLGSTNYATGSTQNVAAGNYNIHEDQKTDYHFTSVACTRNNQTFTVTQAETTAVTVNPGDTIVCTYINTRDTGTIEVIKNINPTDDAGVFDLKISGTTHKEDASHGDTTGAVQVTTGSYDVSELAGDANTDLADYSSRLTCTKNGQALITNVATTDSDNFTVASTDSVVCTFTNTRYGHIIVEKQTLPDGNTTQSFEFDTNYDFANFNLKDGEQNDSGNLLPGTYSASEENIPDGWDLTDITCSDRSNVTAIDLAAGETVTCVFTNTQRGSITIIKDAQPDSDEEFKFTGSLGDSENEEAPNFTLIDDGENDITDRRLFEDLTPGTYTVTEPNVIGWTLESISCEGGLDADQDKENNRNAVINLAPGENVTCTFVNTRDTGSIKVNKLLDNDGDEVFETMNPEAFTWSLDDAGANAMGSTVTGVETGEHSVNENSVEGFHFVGWFPGSPVENDFSCTNLPKNAANTSLPVSLDVDKDAVSEITLCNARDTGNITVNKNVDMNADGDTDDEEDIIGATDWTWDLGTADFATGSTQEVGSGTYTIHEDQKAPDYEFVSVTCVNNQEQVLEVNQAESFDVTIADGDNIVCTFTNQKKTVSLTLAKANNRPAPTVVGDVVTYTLTVTVPEDSGTVYNAMVTDIPPEGFEYIPGSETATTGSLTKTYASPGQWSLGDLAPGAVVVLTYQTRILNTASAGTYPDIAYAEGCDTEAVEGDCEINVYSNVTNINEDGTPFVGTRVAIRGPQVLGASTTRLVNTGAADIWRNLAVGTLLMGVAFTSLYRRQKKGGRA